MNAHSWANELFFPCIKVGKLPHLETKSELSENPFTGHQSISVYFREGQLCFGWCGVPVIKLLSRSPDQY